MEASDTPTRRVVTRFLSDRGALVCAVLLGLVLVAVLLGPVLSPYSPEQLSDAQFEPPSVRHWFGTDVHGRDVLVRVLVGARISMLVASLGALVSLVVGVSWGSIAGYVGGKTDQALMRVVDILYALPSIIFVIVLITSLEEILKASLPASMTQNWGAHIRLLFLFAGLGAVSWLTMARIVRGQVITLRNLPFVEAARALGVSSPRILLRHILPNVLGIVMVYMMLTIPSIILYESFLSYLGLGIQPPMASWGSLIAEGAANLNSIRIYWWLIVFPAGTLVLTLLALNFVGDALRDAVEGR